LGPVFNIRFDLIHTRWFVKPLLHRPPVDPAVQSRLTGLSSWRDVVGADVNQAEFDFFQAIFELFH